MSWCVQSKQRLIVRADTVFILYAVKWEMYEVVKWVMADLLCYLCSVWSATYLYSGFKSLDYEVSFFLSGSVFTGDHSPKVVSLFDHSIFTPNTDTTLSHGMSSTLPRTTTHTPEHKGNPQSLLLWVFTNVRIGMGIENPFSLRTSSNWPVPLELYASNFNDSS